MASTLRLATAQSTVPNDPYDRAALRAAGAEIRDLMTQAAAAGARVVQFPEGSIVYPNKYVVSVNGPAELGEADWDRAAWDVIREETEAVVAHAGRLGIWTGFGAPHREASSGRPLNSFFLVSDEGRVVARYDKRILSNTESTYMFAPGTDAVVVDIDGFRVGTALCIEARFPELFAEYERWDVDAVLLSTDGAATPVALIAQAYGALYNYWLGFSVPAPRSALTPSGVVAPGGAWSARCPADGRPGFVVADLERDPADPDAQEAIRFARPWRRSVRSARWPS